MKEEQQEMGLATVDGEFDENSFAIMPVVNLQQALQRYQQMKDFVDKVLKPSVDYGIIPGTTKNTLLKPGAEKLAWLFGLHPVFSPVSITEDWTGKDHDGEPFFNYRMACALYRGNRLVVQADGSCNSHEKKYRYRDSQRKCPNCGKPTLFQSKKDPEFYCWAKKGGCGATFPLTDERITKQETGQIPNPDVADLANTLLKMAEKRALIAAVLIGANASEWFTQDVEDFIDGSFVDTGTGEVRQPQQQPAQPGQQTSRPATPPAQRQPAQPTAGTVAGEMQVVIGKTNKYPASWAAQVMPLVAAKKCTNSYEMDGILQKLLAAGEIAPGFPADIVLIAVQAYLTAKAQGAEDPMVIVHSVMEAGFPPES